MIVMGRMIIVISSVTALDIGHANIKLVELTRKRGSVCVSACEMIPTPKGAIERGHIRRPLDLADAIKDIFDMTSAGKSRVCVVSSGVEMDIRFVELPKMPAAEVRSAVLWELKDTVVTYRNVSHEDIIADYHIVDGNVNNPVMSMVVVSTTKSVLYGYLDMLSSLKIRPVLFDMGVLNMHWTCNGGSASRCYVIVGASSVQLYITEKGQYGLCRVIPFGGDCVTGALSDCLNVSLDHAETIKREKDLDTLMKTWEEGHQAYVDSLNRIVLSILQSLEYGRQQRRLSSIADYVDSIIVTGGETKIEGFAKLFEEQIDVRVARCDPFDNLEFDKRLDYDHCMALSEFVAPAVAIALRGMDEL